MTFFRRIGLDSVAWALRRFYAPVNSDALVLEVGAGGNPYPRANVLLDAYETTRERHWVPLTADRPTVLGFVENLPFKDLAFDFVIAAHVLEHSTDPVRFLSELQRVARAGYIEVPDAFMERINPYMDHRLEITCRDNQLIIRKKNSWRHDPEVVELYEDRVKSFLPRDLISKRPFEFHVRYYWSDRISYEIVNPDGDATWAAPVVIPDETLKSVGIQIRQRTRDFLRKFLSQTRRNKAIDLMELMRCANCLADRLSREPRLVRCGACGETFPVRDGVVVMNACMTSRD